MILTPRFFVSAVIFCIASGRLKSPGLSACGFIADVAVILRMCGGEVAFGVGGLVQPGPRGLERIAMQHQRVDAGAGLHIVEKRVMPYCSRYVTSA